MRIISLACKSCGAPLQIKEEMDQLACGHCGAQMYVERGGGAVSLQLVEAIRTGAAHTAAELALVRLQKEHAQSSSRVHQLEGIAQGMAQSRESFSKHDLMSDQAVASARDRAAALAAEVERSWIPIVGGSTTIILIVVWLLAWMAQNGVSRAVTFVFGGILAIVVFFLVMGSTAFLDGVREDRVKARLKEVQGQMTRHQTALAHQAGLSAAAEAVEQLASARAELARIQEEIASNRNIVSRR